jgi:hypothetical protein
MVRQLCGPARSALDSTRVIRVVMAVPGVAARIKSFVRRNPAALSKAAYLTAAALLFVAAGWNRFSLPQDPLAVPDTYLWPAVSKLSGGAFVHLQGLNFLYPGMIYMILRTFGDFRAISIWQHLLGLAAGALFLASWSRLVGFFPRPRVSRVAHEAMGLFGGGIYLLSTAPLSFEMSIQSDGVCMFFEMLVFWLVIEFFSRRVVAPKSPMATIFGISVVVSAFVLASLKPSFTLMAVVTVVAVIWSMLSLKNNRAAKLVFCGMTVFVVAVLTLTEHHLRRNDRTAKTFLPLTLFAIHAKIINRQMIADLEKGETGGYSREWLRTACDDLGRQIERTHELYPDAFPRLGFQPDYLHHGADSVLNRWRRELGDDAFVGLLRYWYWRSLATRPMEFITKIVGQMEIFYSLDCPAFRSRKKWPLSSSYARSLSALSYRRWGQLLSEIPSGSAFLERTQNLASQNIVVRQNSAVQLCHVSCARTYLPILFISVPLVGLVLLKPNGSETSKWPAFWVLFFYFVTFANVLGVSVVHSMEIPRYSTVLFVSVLFAQLWAIRWLIETGLATFAKPRSSRSASIRRSLLDGDRRLPGRRRQKRTAANASGRPRQRRATGAAGLLWFRTWIGPWLIR